MTNLVLTRSRLQSIIIADNIKITVIGVQGGQVRMAFEAPREIIILREEIYYRAIRGVVVHGS